MWWKKNVVIYPNNKPYITKKECINNKKQAFGTRNKVGLAVAQKKLKYHLKKAKEQHRQAMEDSFCSNTRKLWETMKLVTNMISAKKHFISSDNLQRANELNNFCLRFEAHDGLKECQSILQALPDTKDTPWVEIDPQDVQHILGVCAPTRPLGHMGCPLSC